MKPWLIFGGSSGIGSLLVSTALQQRRDVTVLVRQSDVARQLQSQGVKAVIGDACDSACVIQAFEMAGTDAEVISTIGSLQGDYLANRNIIDYAERSGNKRMVLVTSLGCGDSWPTLSERAKAAFGRSVREKSLGESWLQTSALDYVIFRPGGLYDGDATGKAECYQRQEVHGLVMRKDIALLIEKVLQREILGNQVYSVVDPTVIRQRS